MGLHLLLPKRTLCLFSPSLNMHFIIHINTPGLLKVSGFWSGPDSARLTDHGFILILFPNKCYSFLGCKSQIQLYFCEKNLWSPNGEGKADKHTECTDLFLRGCPWTNLHHARCREVLLRLLAALVIFLEPTLQQAFSWLFFFSLSPALWGCFPVLHSGPLYSFCCLLAPDNLGEGWRER